MPSVVHRPPAAVRAQAAPVEVLLDEVDEAADEEDPLAAGVPAEPLSEDDPLEEPEPAAAGSLALLLLRLSVR